MRTLRMFVAVVGVVVMSHAGVAAAQGKPNFSGTWTLTDPKPSSGTRTRDGSPSGVERVDRSLTLNNTAFACGDECTIIQTATTLTVKRPPNAQGITAPDVVLYLDGRESKNLDAGWVGRPPVEYASRATWDGATLVTTRPTAGGQLNAIRSIALDAGMLVIVTSTDFPGMLSQTWKYTKR